MYQKRRRPFALPKVRPARVALLLAPVLGLVALVAVLLLGGFVHTVSGGVPVESVVVEDVRLTPGNLALTVRNDSQTPVTIGQVMVDDAFRPFTVTESTVDRLAATVVEVPYPWEPAVPVHVALLTSTGTVIEHEIASPSLTPVAGPVTFGTLALIGLTMAAIPVALGLLWLPAIRRASPRVVGAVMAFTLGLLVFLLIDSTAEGLELAATLGSLNGVGVFALGALGAMAVFAAVESLGRYNLARLVAIGIGLHNLGEGLAVGTAMRIGEVALGTALVIGFAIHNLTEGVAIAAPLANPQLTSNPQPAGNKPALSPPADKMARRAAPGIGRGLASGRFARFAPPAVVGTLRPSGCAEGLLQHADLRPAVPGNQAARGKPGEDTASRPSGNGSGNARVRVWRLVLLAAVAGLPAIPGLWLGGLTAGGLFAVLGLGVAAGAIAQVVVSIGRLVVGKVTPLVAGSFVAAVGVMYVTGLLA